MPLYSNTIDAPPSTAGGPPSDFDAKSGAIGPPPSAQPSGPSLLQNIKETWTEAEILPDTTYQHHYQRKIKHYQDGFNKFGSGLVKSPGIVGDLRPLISMAGDAHLPKIDNPFWTMLVHLQCAGLKELRHHKRVWSTKESDSPRNRYSFLIMQVRANRAITPARLAHLMEMVVEDEKGIKIVEQPAGQTEESVNDHAD
jgi:hypothetical protein